MRVCESGFLEEVLLRRRSANAVDCISEFVALDLITESAILRTRRRVELAGEFLNCETLAVVVPCRVRIETALIQLVTKFVRQCVLLCDRFFDLVEVADATSEFLLTLCLGELSIGQLVQRLEDG